MGEIIGQIHNEVIYPKSFISKYATLTRGIIGGNDHYTYFVDIDFDSDNNPIDKNAPARPIAVFRRRFAISPVEVSEDSLVLCLTDKMNSLLESEYIRQKALA